MPGDVENIIKVKGKRLRDFLDRKVDFLKMDIEGSEFSVIDSIDEINIPQISIEFHHWLGDKASWSHGQINNPYTIEDTRDCIKKLEELGYTVAYTEGSGDREIEEVLFIRSDLYEKIRKDG